MRECGSGWRSRSGALGLAGCRWRTHRLVQDFNGAEGAAFTVRLPVENAIYRGLAGAEFFGNTRLAPVRRVLDFPQQGSGVLVHEHKHIREWIVSQSPNG